MNDLKIKYILLFILTQSFCHAQNDSITVKNKDILDVIHSIFHKHDTIQKTNQKKLAFSLLPVPVGVNSNSGLVVSFLTTFYLGEDHEKTKMSQITFSPYFSFSNQYVFPVQSYIYTSENKWNFIGDYRYMIYPQLTYGLGEHDSKNEMSTLDYKQWRFYQFITRQIVGNYRLGVGFLFDNYKNISEESYIEEPTDYYQYMDGNYADETSFGFAIQGLYDSRKNIINPEGGLYIEADLRMNTSGVNNDK